MKKNYYETASIIFVALGSLLIVLSVCFEDAACVTTGIVLTGCSIAAAVLASEREWNSKENLICIGLAAAGLLLISIFELSLPAIITGLALCLISYAGLRSEKLAGQGLEILGTAAQKMKACTARIFNFVENAAETRRNQQELEEECRTYKRWSPSPAIVRCTLIVGLAGAVVFGGTRAIQALAAAHDPYGDLMWPKAGISTALPEPASAKGAIVEDSPTVFTAVVDEVSGNDFRAYVAQCTGAGFTDKFDRTETSYTAQNEAGDTVLLRLDSGDLMHVKLHIAKDTAKIQTAFAESIQLDDDGAQTVEGSLRADTDSSVQELA